MPKRLLNIKIDADIKKQAQRRAREMGVPLSTVVNAYINEFVRSPSVTFTAEPERLRPEVEKEIAEALEDFKNGRNIAGPFEDMHSLIKDLRS